MRKASIDTWICASSHAPPNAKASRIPVAIATDFHAILRRHSGVMREVMVVNIGAIATGSMATKKVTSEARNSETINAP
ncbi:MAG: hypothetical protein BroJett013_07780 [Alphaproteobacteria bacterium]|nr:MAG: hypothetical protein BroJett013_07780 [Alphaproteobacteria bacterium]